ncbi:hypothetical protein CDD83_9637 [Cordyceps sp. RAO-2017]|nr:hypothetical protein CDD83_9637 [Cordyceps sp. RAO-2017]
MATTNRCLRGLLRPSSMAAAPSRLQQPPAAPFSSTPGRAAGEFARTTDGFRKRKSMQQRNPPPPPLTGTKPKPGERKAFRKRIQLENSSALPVQGLGELGPETLAADDSSGRLFALPERATELLGLLEAFKPTQTWAFFQRPHVLVRAETVQLIKGLEESKANKEAFKCVLTGERLSGKSTALLQAMTHALLNGWVVINIPEGQDLTNGNTEYSPIEKTEPLQFAQPVYCLKLLQTIHKVNRAVLQALPCERNWSHLASSLGSGASLADLALSAREAELAWPTLEALWTELTLPGRPPVLFGLDGLSHINRVSQYRDPSFRPVHAHDLALVRLFLDALTGRRPLPNGGAVVAATSRNNAHRLPSQELVLAQLEAGQAGAPVPTPNPYERRYDERVYDALKNCRVLRLGRLAAHEARALMEYWGASGLLQDVVDSRLLAEKWALGGHGNIGEMERASLMAMRM